MWEIWNYKIIWDIRILGKDKRNPRNIRNRLTKGMGYKLEAE